MKNNSETSTLRSGSKPKASKVEEAKPVKSAYKKAVDAQNTSLLSDNTRVTNVTANSGKSKLISVVPNA